MRMNDFWRWTLIVGCCIGMFSGCKQTGSELLFQTLSVAKNEPLCVDSQKPSCEIDIHLLYADENDSVAFRINRELVKVAFNYDNLSPKMALDSFVNHRVNSYREELLPYFLEDKKNETVSESWFNHSFRLRSEAGKGKPGVVNYVFNVESYEGGAHGSETLTYLNFSEQDGQRISLDDVLVAGYESELCELLLNALMKQNQVSTLKELQDKGYLLWSSMYVPGNFLLKEDGIEFVYNAYEIAPYALGATQLTLSYAELNGLLKE